jgi:hypothetical protein
MLILLLAYLMLNKHLFAQSTPAQASEYPVSSYECTQVTISDIDESLLTTEEKIARLDNSLSESIDSYTSCVNAVQKAMSGGGSGSGSGSGGGAGEQEAQSSGAGFSGEESENSQTNEQGRVSNQAGSVPAAPTQTPPTEVKRGVVAPKDNDSIICKLLYDEIQNADPASLAGLEKQYQDYKCGN